MYIPRAWSSLVLLVKYETFRLGSELGALGFSMKLFPEMSLISMVKGVSAGMRFYRDISPENFILPEIWKDFSGKFVLFMKLFYLGRIEYFFQKIRSIDLSTKDSKL